MTGRGGLGRELALGAPGGWALTNGLALDATFLLLICVPSAWGGKLRPRAGRDSAQSPPAAVTCRRILALPAAPRILVKAEPGTQQRPQDDVSLCDETLRVRPLQNKPGVPKAAHCWGVGASPHTPAFLSGSLLNSVGRKDKGEAGTAPDRTGPSDFSQ